MTARTTAAIAAALLTMGLGACSRSSDDPASTGNAAEAPPMVEPAAEATPDVPEPSATPVAAAEANQADAPPPPVAPAPDEQMMDDAAATGMTARTSRDETVANVAPPVEQVERK